jgi:hypothetical protein
MKVRKFIEFIKEELHDTPETYIATLLQKLKVNIDKMFEDQMPDEDNGGGKEKSVKQAKSDSKDKNRMSFKDLGIQLESSEISKYSKMYDSLTITFTDDHNMYTLILMIDIKEGIPKDPNQDFSIDDIEKCYIKFKKYNVDTFDIIGQLSKNVEVKKVDEEFIINLKIELDEMFGDEDEEFKIETE